MVEQEEKRWLRALLEGEVEPGVRSGSKSVRILLLRG